MLEYKVIHPKPKKADDEPSEIVYLKLVKREDGDVDLMRLCQPSDDDDYDDDYYGALLVWFDPTEDKDERGRTKIHYNPSQAVIVEPQ